MLETGCLPLNAFLKKEVEGQVHFSSSFQVLRLSAMLVHSGMAVTHICGQTCLFSFFCDKQGHPEYLVKWKGWSNR